MIKLFSKKQLEILLPILFVVLGFVFECIGFYPGFMSRDSLVQYGAAKSLEFGDWHPPIMAIWWSVLNRCFDGPQGLLYFHQLCLWLALYIWYYQYRSNRYSWFILGVGVLPWIINFSGVLWKDVGMAFSLLLFSSLINTKKNTVSIMLAFLTIFYALNLRHNAIFAVPPLLGCFLKMWRPRSSWLVIGVFTIASSFGLLKAGNLLSYGLMKAKNEYTFNYIIIDDLTRISLERGQSLIPNVTLDEIKSCALTDSKEVKIFTNYFCLSELKSESGSVFFNYDLKYLWIEQIKQDPLNVLKLRINAFMIFLNSKSYYIWHPGVDDNVFKIYKNENNINKIIKKIVFLTAKLVPFLFMPSFWLWLGVHLILISCAFSTSSIVQVMRTLLISGVFYILGYLPITTAADFRFIYWSVIAISLAVLLFVINRKEISLRRVRILERFIIVVVSGFSTYILFI